MKAGYKIKRGYMLVSPFDYLVLFNFPYNNEVAMYQYTFDELKVRNSYEVGCWKLKNKKQ